MQAVSGKENNLDEETKTSVPKNSIKPKAKTREFGRELTNTSQANKDKKTQNAQSVRAAAKLPKTSIKISKLTSHFTLSTPAEYLCGKDLKSLSGKEFEAAINEEMTL
jgi:hypothetical protein